jgi:tryptophan-rich sensory protein
MSTRSRFLRNPIFVAGLCAFAVAMLGGSITQLGPWYYSLEQPGWKPPDWAFAPAWTIIFALAALSGAEAWRRLSNARARTGMVCLFGLNALFNVGWSALFFLVQRPDLALLEVGLLWASVLLLIVLLWRPARRAALYLVPYLVWVTFAAALNAAVVQLNSFG